MSDHPINKYVAKRQITVKVQYGKDLRKAKCFSSGMSTYVEVSLGSDTRKTKTQKKAGRDPKWYDEMIFNYDNEPHLEIKCWCENGCCGETLVGAGYLNLPPPARIDDHNIPLSYKGNTGAKFGLVNILVTFTDQGIEHLERDAAKDALKAAGVAMDPTGAPLKTAAAPAAAPLPITINVVQNNGGASAAPASAAPASAAGQGRWQWKHNGNWKDMDASVNGILEQGYRASQSGGPNNKEVTMGGAKFSIHFKKMKQMNLATKTTRDVRRI